MNISKVYAKFLKGIHTDYESIRDLSYELICIKEHKRVFTFLQRADQSSTDLERISNQVINLLNRLCLAKEISGLIVTDPWEQTHTLTKSQPALLRRHITMYTNYNGYFFTLSNRRIAYYVGRREYRDRIECSSGYEYDLIRQKILKGDTACATEMVKEKWKKCHSTEECALVLIMVGFCLETSLIIADRARGSAPRLELEVSFDEYLTWLEILIYSINENERKDFIDSYLEKHENIPDIPDEARDAIKELCISLKEDLLFFDAQYKIDCKHCHNL